MRELAKVKPGTGGIPLVGGKTVSRWVIMAGFCRVLGFGGWSPCVFCTDGLSVIKIRRSGRYAEMVFHRLCLVGGMPLRILPTSASRICGIDLFFLDGFH